jgi:hypothetical protein
MFSALSVIKYLELVWKIEMGLECGQRNTVNRQQHGKTRAA